MKHHARPYQSVWVEGLERRVVLSATLPIRGILPVALDQPRTNVYLAQTPTGAPLAASSGSGFDIVGSLDTGYAGTRLSSATAASFGLSPQTSGGYVVGFDDPMSVDQLFKVSTPLYTNLAPYPVANGAVVSSYTQQSSPAPLELATQAPTMQAPANVFGTPQMLGKVLVMDPSPLVNNASGTMRSYLYLPGTPFNAATATSNPGIPATSLQVRLSYASLAGYTFESPPGAPAPASDPVPFIGPNPLTPDSTPPVAIGLGSASATGSFLLDTGNTSSFISQALAGRLGVQYRPGTYNSSSPLLVDSTNTPIPNQFSLTLSSMGQTVNAAGFYLDSLSLNTQQGTTVQFLGAPVLVADIAIENPNTGQNLTLDGDLGMNFFAPGTNANGSGFGNAQDFPFSWVTVDQPHALLGLQPAPARAPAVADAQLFYNNSMFDNYDPGINAADDGAVAIDKTPLLNSQTASFANISSYSKGINGIIIDIVNLPSTISLSASDFVFRTGNSATLSSWTAAPVPKGVAVRSGAGTNLVSRVEITWADGTIRNTWLQVTVNADASTGLATPYVFYFGNLVGSSGQPPVNGTFSVTSADMTAAANDPHSFLNPAPITNLHDYNRDGQVNSLDQLIARLSSGHTLTDLAVPASGLASQLPTTTQSPKLPIRRVDAVSASGESVLIATLAAQAASGAITPFTTLVPLFIASPQSTLPWLVSTHRRHGGSSQASPSDPPRPHAHHALAKHPAPLHHPRRRPRTTPSPRRRLEWPRLLIRYLWSDKV